MALTINGQTFYNGAPLTINGVQADYVTVQRPTDPVPIEVWHNIVDIELPQFTQSTNMREWLDETYPDLVSVRLINRFIQPRLTFGDFGERNIILLNWGEIRGTNEGYDALVIKGPSVIRLVNKGIIRGAGGHGGDGGKGGKGKDITVYDWKIKGPTNWSCVCVSDIYTTVWRWDGVVVKVEYDVAFVPKDTVITGDDGNVYKCIDGAAELQQSRIGQRFDVYVTGGEGGEGGEGGYGASFNTSQTDGAAGANGKPPTPSGYGGYYGGKGGDGGDGGTWGQDGAAGEDGATGGGGGQAGQPGTDGTPAGAAIRGTSYLTAGSEIGDVRGALIP